MKHTETVEVDGSEYAVTIDTANETATLEDNTMLADIQRLVEEHVINEDDDGNTLEVERYRYMETTRREKVMVSLDTSDASSFQQRNHFTGGTLNAFFEEGYVPVAIGSEAAWFSPVEEVAGLE